MQENRLVFDVLLGESDFVRQNRYKHEWKKACISNIASQAMAIATKGEFLEKDFEEMIRKELDKIPFLSEQ